jgi:hypothetical protein
VQAKLPVAYDDRPAVWLAQSIALQPQRHLDLGQDGGFGIADFLAAKAHKVAFLGCLGNAFTNAVEPLLECRGFLTIAFQASGWKSDLVLMVGASPVELY